MNESENSYLILELNPDIFDKNIINRAIQAKQAQWSREVNHFDTDIKRSAQENLRKLPSIKQKMSDPVTRKEEAKKAKKIITQIRKAKEKEFKDAVLLLSKGNLTNQAIDNLAVKFKAFYYNEKDIRDYLNQLVVSSVIDEVSEGNNQGLEKTVAQTIRKHLNFIKEKTLYDFLGVSSTALITSIQNKTEELYKQLKILPINPTNDAKRDLIGYCSAIFKTEENRKQYDQTLIEEKLHPFRELIYRACDSGSIEVGQVLILINKGKQYKISTQKALRLIRGIAGKRKIAFNVANNLDFNKTIQCVCGNRNEPLNERCKQCKIYLYYKCSQCHKSLSIDLLNCSCGFSLDEGFNTLNTALKNNDMEYFYSSWNEGLYRGHPAFQSFAKEYDSIKKVIEERKLEELKFKKKINALKTAIVNKDYSVIRTEWDVSLLTIYPELDMHLPVIKKAFKPADVKKVEAVNYSSYIQVMWQIENPIQQYLVAWSTTVFPTKPMSADYKIITRGEYERIGFRIENPLAECYYIKVFSVIKFMDSELYSPGTSPGCCKFIGQYNKITIKYCFFFKGFIKKSSGVIVVKTSKEVTKIPKLVIIARPGTILPAGVESGILIHTITPRILSGKILEEEFSLKSISSPARFRLFVHNPDERETIELIPVSIEKHRI